MQDTGRLEYFTYWMSTSNSPAETPDFAAPAETNTGSDNTVASASTGSVLTDRKSLGSGMSQALSWSVVGGQQAVVTPVEVQPMEISERSRPSKRIEHNGPRSSVTSKSPRRVSEARGSDQPLTADQRLDQLIAGSIRETTWMGGGLAKYLAHMSNLVFELTSVITLLSEVISWLSRPSRLVILTK